MWLGTKSVQVTEYSASKKGYLLVRRACFSQNPARGTKVREDRMPGTWKRDGFRRGGLENKRYRQAIDTRLRRNKKAAEAEPDPKGSERDSHLNR